MAPPAPPRVPAILVLAALLAGALAPLAALPGALAQGQLSSDLQVVSVHPGTPRVNQTANVSALVKNHGIQNLLTFSVTFGATNSSTPLAPNSTVAYPANAANFVGPRNETGAADPGCLTPVNGLRAGCSVEVHYTWTPPLVRKGPLNLSAEGFVGQGYADPNPGNNILVAPAFVAHHQLGLRLDPADNRQKEVRPGDAAVYRVTVRNLGNLRENVSLRLQSAEWPASRLTATRVAVEAGGAAEVLALVEAPTGDGQPVAASANVTASSVAAPALGRAVLDLPSTLRREDLQVSYGFRPELPAEAFVATGGASPVRLPVRNLGAEDALRWSVVTRNLSEGWNVSFPSAWSALPGPSGTVGHVDLEARTDAALPPGASVVVEVRAESLNGGAAHQANLTLRTAAPDLALEALRADRAAFYQGDSVLLQADVKNTGRVPMAKPARLLVQAVRGAEAVLVGDVLLSGLGPGDGRTLVVPWATGNLSGAFDLLARLDPDGDIAEVREDNNDRTLPALVRLHGLAVTAPPAREARPGDRLDLGGAAAFRVRNLGNAPEEVLVELSTARGWANARELLRLAPGEEAPLNATVAVPLLPGTLAEEVRVRAVLANRSATVGEAAMEVRVLDREAPLLERLDAPDFVELGTAAEVFARFLDAVGVREATFHMRQPDGTLRREGMRELANGTWAATVVLAQPGAVSHWVTATDRAPSNNTLDTRGNPGAILVGVRSAPLLELLAPRNDSVVRSGVPVRLRVTDVHGVGEVVVREGGRSFTIEEPWVVATAGLSEGPHDFEVVARNRYGNPATLTFRLTIDDTAPRLQDGRVTPARPAPGEQVRVEARTSADARLAGVQVMRDGRALAEVPATVGLGEVTAELSLSEPGRHVLAVRVEDAAGNAATLDLPVDVGGGVPGPGLAALAAALGLGAALRRKRRAD